MPFFPSFPEGATTKEIFAARADAYRHFLPAIQAIMRAPAPITPAEREVIGAYVSALNACQYCYGGHRAAAEAFGIDGAVIDGLLEDIATAPVDDRLRPIFAYVKKLTLAPARMTQADADAVFAAGWDEKALHYAVAVCCMFNFMNRLVEGHGVEGDPTKFVERGRRHAEMGYVAQYPGMAGETAGE